MNDYMFVCTVMLHDGNGLQIADMCHIKCFYAVYSYCIRGVGLYEVKMLDIVSLCIKIVL